MDQDPNTLYNEEGLPVLVWSTRQARTKTDKAIPGLTQLLAGLAIGQSVALGEHRRKSVAPISLQLKIKTETKTANDGKIYVRRLA